MHVQGSQGGSREVLAYQSFLENNGLARGWTPSEVHKILKSSLVKLLVKTPDKEVFFLALSCSGTHTPLCAHLSSLYNHVALSSHLAHDCADPTRNGHKLS